MGPTVLFVDLFCPDGHGELNRVFLRGLIAAGARVDGAFKIGYAEKLDVPGIGAVFDFPERFFDERCGPLRGRWNQWMLLMAIRARINVERYAMVFFSSFDELTVIMSGRWPGAVFLNHANIAGMDHPLKRRAMLGLGDDCTFVVFHEFVARRAREQGLYRVDTLPQGLPSPYPPVESAEAVLASIDSRLGGNRSQRIIFVPSGAKYADGFIRHLCQDPEFAAFLETQGAVLVLKGMALPDVRSSMIGVEGRLSTVQYRALFNASTALVLHYPPTFTYRVSATLMECFANQKPCLLSAIESFEAFSKHFEYRPYYRNKAELMEGIELLIRRSAAGFVPYRDVAELMPDVGRALPGWLWPSDSAL
jgi:hypothetical protein